MTRAKGFINTPIPYATPTYPFYAPIWDHATDRWNVIKFLSDGSEQFVESFAFKEDADEFIAHEQIR
jgi:peroxiredoxin